jgi:hypothetical protein
MNPPSEFDKFNISLTPQKSPPNYYLPSSPAEVFLAAYSLGDNENNLKKQTEEEKCDIEKKEEENETEIVLVESQQEQNF